MGPKPACVPVTGSAELGARHPHMGGVEASELALPEACGRGWETGNHGKRLATTAPSSSESWVSTSWHVLRRGSSGHRGVLHSIAISPCGRPRVREDGPGKSEDYASSRGGGGPGDGECCHVPPGWRHWPVAQCPCYGCFRLPGCVRSGGVQAGEQRTTSTSEAVTHWARPR